MPDPTPTLRRVITLESEEATIALARCLAPRLQTGDTLLLSGPIGAGKTFFARALIRSLLDNPAEDVPSPSFTLVQTYQAPGMTIWHADLYRLNGPEGVEELGLVDAMEQGLSLVEWPDRLGPLSPPQPLTLEFQAGEAGHKVTVSGGGVWAERLGAFIDPA